jgi:hypothetical protein
MPRTARRAAQVLLPQGRMSFLAIQGKARERSDAFLLMIAHHIMEGAIPFTKSADEPGI